MRAAFWNIDCVAPGGGTEIPGLREDLRFREQALGENKIPGQRLQYVNPRANRIEILVDCRGNQESLMVAIVGRKVGTAAAQAAGRLQFTADAAAALANADVAWVTFDTPVDENDVPQVVAVVEPVKGFLPHVPDGCLVLVSAQLPVGTTRRFGLQWANLNDTDN